MSGGGSDPIPVTPELLAGHLLPWPDGGGGKEERGRILIVAGSSELPGAALLAGMGALRAGAGKLQVCTVRSISLHLGLTLPEALVVGLDETPDGAIAPSSADAILDHGGRCQSMLIGPGLVENEDTARLTAALVAGAGSCPLLLDAAAMMRIRAEAGSLSRLEGRAILTPHAGEMAKMMGLDKDEVEHDPPGTARRAAAELGAVVVLKGARSIVALPDGTAWACEHGNAGLATSGSGDTLAGIMAGLLARGAEPHVAAIWAVYLHGEAGIRLSASRGPLGFLAREIPDEVPAILADLDPRRH